MIIFKGITLKIKTNKMNKTQHILEKIEEINECIDDFTKVFYENELIYKVPTFYKSGIPSCNPPSYNPQFENSPQFENNSPSAPPSKTEVNEDPLNTNYKFQQQPQSQQPVIINNIINKETPQSNFLYPFLYPTRETIIIKTHPQQSSPHQNYSPQRSNKEEIEEKKKEKKEDSIVPLAIAVATVGAIIVGGVHYATKDEYIQFYMSKITTLFNELKDLTLNTNQEDRYNELLKSYVRWETLFTKRTFKKLKGKGGITLSAGLIALGIGFGGMFFLAGAVGIVGSSSYLIWNNASFNDTKKTEIRYFNELVRVVDEFREVSRELENKSEESTNPFTDQEIHYPDLHKL